ncbi:autotransporter outer membrane beta-barrel domain-containing protein [Acinetobacter sp. MB5]|uniref:autotransporter outer membrane beta-barrel domain-containing protein n=1 Tax=Acinetobacter sp. MB5 TaxID=2069438 RepID=UPI000DD00F29|nr:autotransporter outer membrane beta-barrel domain-containing protein [Acinetobacter sp. MB5]
MLGVTVVSQAEDVVNPSNGSSVSTWGDVSGTQVYGQTFTSSSTQNLTSFTFYLTKTSGTTATNFRAYIYEWDEATSSVVGSAAFASDVITLDMNVSDTQAVTVSTKGTTLSQNKTYVIFFSTVGESGTSSYTWLLGQSTANGKFVFYNVDDLNTLLTTSWVYWLSSYDLAYIFSFGPSAADTLASMQGNVTGLRQVFALQSDTLNDGLNQSCSSFNDDRSCISLIGRYVQTNGSNGTEATTGGVNLAYKLTPNFYIGGSIEQIASDTESGNVKYRQNAPDVGFYTGWTQGENGDGWQARFAYRHSDGQVTVTREAIGSAEAGVGTANLTGDGYQFSVGNAVRLDNQALITPYIGVRYTDIKRHGYSEAATDSVTQPLQYAALSQKATTVLAGSNFEVPLMSKLNLTGNLGVEKDVQFKVDNYVATGVDGLEPIKFADKHNDIRAVAGLGLKYNFAANQQLSIQANYKEQAYAADSSTSATLAYTTSF